MSDLVTRFQQNLKQHDWLHKKILVAISGGLDSMVLAMLLKQADVEIELAHCNFQLRGEESDGDEQFVRDFAAKMKIPLQVQRFQTKMILQEDGGNLEEIARDLRYNWFEKLRKESGCDFIATAHHQQDSIETLLINFFKGTGIAGMHGILPARGKVIRPLLPFTKEELTLYAQKNELNWREDSSNATNDYLRNQIRHHLLPEIESVFPQAKTALEGNIERMQEVEILYRQAIEVHRKRLLERRNEEFCISILKIKNAKPVATILYELLMPFGFTAAQLPDIIRLLDAPSGKWVGSEKYRLIRDRKYLIVTSQKSIDSGYITIEKPSEKYQIEGDFGRLSLAPAQNIKIQERSSEKSNNKELIALKDTDFPLILRTLRDGDYFYPIGMQRKKKKIGKFLRDLKVPLHEKEKVWVLESQKRIVWILGYRLDDRFKIQNSATDIWSLSVEKKTF